MFAHLLFAHLYVRLMDREGEVEILGYRGLERKDVASSMYLFIRARSVPSIPL